MKKIIATTFALLFLNQSYVCTNDLLDWWEIETTGNKNLLAAQNYEYLSHIIGVMRLSSFNYNQESLNHFYYKYCESLKSYVKDLKVRITISPIEMDIFLSDSNWKEETIKFINYITSSESLGYNSRLRYLSYLNPVGTTYEDLLAIKTFLKKELDSFIQGQKDLHRYEIYARINAL